VEKGFAAIDPQLAATPDPKVKAHAAKK
jgi:hypothetical protein